MDDVLTENKVDEEKFVPASLVKRMVAFGMDGVLLFILLQLVFAVYPKLHSDNSQKEFNRLIHQVSLLGSEERLDSSSMAKFVKEANLSTQTYEMLMSMLLISCFLPVLYFFCGENFFQGQTLGKATFGLRTVLLNNFQSPPFGKLLIRSALKGFASLTLITPFFLPGFLNFCFCMFNRQKRCVHDILSKTITVQAKDIPSKNDQ